MGRNWGSSKEKGPKGIFENLDCASIGDVVDLGPSGASRSFSLMSV